MLARIPVIVVFEKFPINVSFAVTFLYVFYYLLLEPVAGVLIDVRCIIYCLGNICSICSHAYILCEFVQC